MIHPRRFPFRGGVIGVAFVVLAVSCGGGGTASEDGGAVSLDDPIVVSSALGGIAGVAAAEAGFREALWDPLRPELGDGAEAALEELDRVVLEAAVEFADSVGVSASAAGDRGGLPPLGVVLALMVPTPLAQADVGLAGFISATVATMGTLGTSGQSGTMPAEGTGVEIEVSGDRIVARIDKEFSIPAGDGLQLTERVKGVIEAPLCPDENGSVAVTIDVVGEATVTDADGVQVHHTLTLSGTATGAVDDNAELTDTAFDVTVGSARQQTGKVSVEGAGDTGQSFVEVRATGAASAGSDTWNANAGITRQSSATNTGEAGHLANMAIQLVNLITKLLLEKAEARWQDGHCVEIVLDGASDQNTVQPGGTLPFTATVVHKHEGGNVTADITAQLSGDRSVEPTDGPSPVSYTYTAGDEAGKTATITLETRSKRGAATKTVNVTTRSDAVDVAFSGTISYSMTGYTLNGAVTIPAVTLLEYGGDDPELKGKWTGTGPVQISMTAEIAGCGKATGTQEGGAVTIVATPTDKDGTTMLSLFAEEMEGGDATMKCGSSGATVAGQGLSIGGGLINLGNIVIPAEPGTYPFESTGVAAGMVQYTVKGEAVVTESAAPSG